MRIVSLLPATTEWACAFGAEADLVGRSHECDFPPSVRALPAVTRASFGAGDSADVDREVRGRLRQGLSLFDVDLDRLRALRPDVVLTQAQCEVCAVSLQGLEKLLGSWTGGRPSVVSIEPLTLKGVFDAGLRIGRAIGRLGGGDALRGQGRAAPGEAAPEAGCRRGQGGRPSSSSSGWRG